MTTTTPDQTTTPPLDGPVCSRTHCEEPAFMKTDDQYVCPEHAHFDGAYFDVDLDTTPETMPAHDTAPADLPLAALVDVVGSAIASCNTLIDTLPGLRHRAPVNADTTEYDLHVKRMYIEAEDKAAEAWRALTHASQLVKGLAR